MKTTAQPRFHPERKAAAFTFIELVLVLVVLAMLVGMHLPFYSRLREQTYIVIDQNNIRQILRGSALYSAENNDYLPHPTWGSDLTGPDGWAYLTSQKSRPVPGALTAYPQSCAGRDVNSAQFTNQLAFFKVGQVSQYLPDVKTAWCPKDAATRESGKLRQLWLARPMKVTSYCWSGTIGGYVGRSQNLNNGTYKIFQFLAGDWQMWEQNDNDSFYFNDAANNPENSPELISYRHTGLKQWWNVRPFQRNLPGAGLVGTFGGEARMVNFARIYDLANRKVGIPNELLNSPGYQ